MAQFVFRAHRDRQTRHRGDFFQPSLWHKSINFALASPRDYFDAPGSLPAIVRSDATLRSSFSMKKNCLNALTASARFTEPANTCAASSAGISVIPSPKVNDPLPAKASIVGQVKRLPTHYGRIGTQVFLHRPLPLAETHGPPNLCACSAGIIPGIVQSITESRPVCAKHRRRQIGGSRLSERNSQTFFR